MRDERGKKESDFGSNPLHHHSAWRTARNVSLAVMSLLLSSIGIEMDL